MDGIYEYKCIRNNRKVNDLLDTITVNPPSEVIFSKRSNKNKDDIELILDTTIEEDIINEQYLHEITLASSDYLIDTLLDLVKLGNNTTRESIIIKNLIKNELTNRVKVCTL